MPAPISPMAEADSRTVTEWPARAMAIAAARPPRPAPTMIVCGVRGVLGGVFGGGGTFSWTGDLLIAVAELQQRN